MREIDIIHQHTNAPLEAFVHGSMCMAYSGRCQISNYLAGRDPNRGACIQACRFNYKFREYALEEELRPGEHFPVYEDNRGTYLLNSKDLCMIEHLPELIQSGVSSFKIEGRLKSIYYVGTVIRAYRQAIDLLHKKPASYEQQKHKFKQELEKVAHRGFTTGFYFNKPTPETNNYASSKPTSDWQYAGDILEHNTTTRLVTVSTRNQIKVGDRAEFITPNEIISFNIKEIYQDGASIDRANPNATIQIPVDSIIPSQSLMRIRTSKQN
ncbi:MAG: putative protease YhbU precursor [bacterium ADurb.Bin400]|nr:MAG: putative protease YhbU precursor [bacterium ADurb.Bin400]